MYSNAWSLILPQPIYSILEDWQVWSIIFFQAIIDSAKVGIPTIAIVDSDCNPNIITYPIPGNDDTLESIQLYLHLFKQAILLGKKAQKEKKWKFYVE